MNGRTLCSRRAPFRDSCGAWRTGRRRAFNYDHARRPMRQDAPDDVVENGSIYVFKPWVREI